MRLRRSRPLPIRALHLLALGLATTVSVAWVCAIVFNPLGDPYGPRPRPVRHGWRMLLPHEQTATGYTDRAMALSRWDQLGSTYFQTDVLTIAGTGGMPPGTLTPESVAGPLLEEVALPWTFGLRKWPPNDDRGFFSARGWPLRALWCGYDLDYTDGTLAGVAKITGGIRVPINDPTSVWYAAPPAPTALPYRPIWLGLAADTVFFAAMWCGLLVGVPALRRRRRRRQGLCEKCGYDLRATPPGSRCPECGHTA